MTELSHRLYVALVLPLHQNLEIDESGLRRLVRYYTNSKFARVGGLVANPEAGEIFYLTIRVYDDQKRFEQVFLKVTEWKDNSIQGVIASEVALVKKYKMGDKLSCKPEDVYDWTISKSDGTEEGNFVGKFLDTYRP